VANKPWENRFPGIFHIKEGTMETGLLNKPGLDLTPLEIGRPEFPEGNWQAI